ncbi:MAG: CSLREA domain-containing protein [Deltaproteobacteria bacterium]|nr:CSLREA domain-containing protein [Deltaproteobacteria bacterium]
MNFGKKINELRIVMSLLLAATVCLAAPSAEAVTFVVNSAADDSDANPGNGTCATASAECTFRAAIEEHNAFGGSNEINFDISPLAPIQPTTALPTINGDLVIDGTTQPGFAGTPIVELDGAFSGLVDGLYMGGNSEIRGLVVINWRLGIALYGGDNVTAAGNYIGVDASGSSAQPNQWGIEFCGANHVIGGPSPADRNVISGNTNVGISAACQNPNISIIGNYVGTDATGTFAIANGFGIFLGVSGAGRSNWTIENNLISGNTTGGLNFGGVGGFVIGNYIGTDVSGTFAIPNGGSYGAVVSWSEGAGSGPVVGGTEAGEGNVISGNLGTGLLAALNIVVMGNYIGTASDGISPLSNTGNGIRVMNLDVTIGGTAPGAGNVIAYNTLAGIDCNGETIIRRNSIFSNGGLGIDINGDGNPSPPYPVLTLALAAGNRVAGTFNGIASVSYIIDFYSNVALDTTGYGEGETWLDSTAIFTDPTGAATFDVNLSAPLVAGEFVTATATTAIVGTTEFSAGFQIGECEPGSGLCCDAIGFFLEEGTECRAAGTCDAAEYCTGMDAMCPIDLPVADDTPCPDADLCNGDETCQSGSCVAGTPPDCNDGNTCTDDSCDSAAGCVNTNNTAACDDGDVCTSGDVCSAGSCAGTAITCDDDNVCTDDSCDSAAGCVYTNNTAGCDDGDVCTSGDVCSGGGCAGTAITCDDDNACTNDSCDPASGCVNTNNTDACDDGDTCTSDDLCSAGRCAGTAVDCSSGSDDCNTGVCNSTTGECETEPVTAGTSCDDGDECTDGEACQGGVCMGGTDVCATGGCGCHVHGNARGDTPQAPLSLLILLGALAITVQRRTRRSVH